MLIFRYARNGTLEIEGLKTIAATCNVAEEGVKGAKDYFEARAKEVYIIMYTGCFNTSCYNTVLLVLFSVSH